MVTLFGKYVRKLRIEHDEILLDMSNKLDVSPAYLSAVEHGRRKIPINWLNKIAKSYNLGSDEIIQLEEIIAKTNENITLPLGKDMSDAKKDLAISFARELDELTDKDIEVILNVLRKKAN